MGMQVLSYGLINAMSPNKRVQKILDIVKKGDVVLIEGKLDTNEELQLTSKALDQLNDKFAGIEIAHLTSLSSKGETLRDKLAKFLVKERFGITVIGPSKKIKEIKMDPQKLEILMK